MRTKTKRPQKKTAHVADTYRALFQGNPHPMWVYDLRTLRFLAVNDAAIAKYGYSREEFLAMTIADIRPPEDVDRLLDNVSAVTNGLDDAGVWHHRKKDGTTIEVEITSHTLVFEGHKAELVLANDLSALRRSERHLRRMTQLFAVLSQVNQATVRMSSQEDLFFAICSIGVEFGRFRFAWIGVYDPQAEKIRPVARAGYEDAYLDYPGLPEMALKEDLKPRLSKGAIVVIDDMVADAACPGCREEALKRGYRSMAIVPIHARGSLCATLNLYAQDPAYFSEDMRALLKEVGADISFAMDSFESERLRHDAEKRLLEKTEELERFFNSTMELLCIASLDGKFIRLNREWERVLGYPISELEGRQFMEFVHPDDLAPTREALERLADRKSVLNFTNRYRTKDGSFRWFEWRSFPAGTLVYAATRDVTEREEAARLRNEGEQRLKVLSEATFEGLVVTKEGIIEECNDRFLEMVGFSRDELIGQPPSVCVAPEHRDLVRRMHAEKSMQPYEHVALRKDGSRFPVEVHARYFAFGGETYRLTAIRDLTAQKKSEENLRESEDRWRFALEGAGDGAWDWYVPTNVVYFSRQWKAMLGYEEDEIPNRYEEWEKRVHPDDLARATDLLNAYVNGTTSSYMCEHRLRCKDGSYKWILDRGKIVRRDADGKPVRIVGTHSDVSERKAAEEELRRRQEFIDRILEHSPIGFAVHTINDGRVVFVSSRFEEIYGVSHEKGSTMESFFNQAYPDTRTREVMRARITEDIASGDPSRMRWENIPITAADGTRKIITAINIPLFEQNMMISTVQDVTERWKAEEALRTSEERFKTTLYSIGDGVITTDVRGMVVQMNKVAETMTGWKEGEAQGKPIAEIFQTTEEEGDLPFRDIVARVVADGTALTLAPRSVLVSRDGARRPIADSAAPIRDSHGEVTGVVVVFTDQTAQHALQARLSQSQKMEAIGRLAGGVAHDFNNMIGVILGYADLLQQDLAAGSVNQRRAQAIVSAAERSANLTKRLLAFARRQDISPIPLNLNDQIDSLRKMLARLIGEDITLAIRPSKDLWAVRIDPTQVDQILANLATNSRDAIGDVGSITIETSNVVVDQAMAEQHPDVTPGEYVAITFTDTGAGMDASVRDRLFEPFFTTKSEGKGTGLGLATIFGIVKQNNGFLDLASAPGEGTTMRIYLPRYYGEPELVDGEAPKLPAGGSETVLVVEDEEQMLALTGDSLAMFGYDVIAARTPAEALQRAQEFSGTIHLLLTDVVMPGMNGKELSARIATLRPDIKIVYMSGYTADVVASRGVLDEGINFIQKPFTPAGIAKKIREVLDMRADADSAREH